MKADLLKSVFLLQIVLLIWPILVQDQLDVQLVSRSAQVVKVKHYAFFSLATHQTMVAIYTHREQLSLSTNRWYRWFTYIKNYFLVNKNYFLLPQATKEIYIPWSLRHFLWKRFTIILTHFLYCFIIITYFWLIEASCCKMKFCILRISYDPWIVLAG